MTRSAGDISETGQTLESYQYLGLPTVVVRQQPQAGMELTYVYQSGDTYATSTDGGPFSSFVSRFSSIVFLAGNSSGGDAPLGWRGVEGAGRRGRRRHGGEWGQAADRSRPVADHRRDADATGADATDVLAG